MRVKFSRVSLMALLLPLFVFSISLAVDPSRYKSTIKGTGNTWDERGTGGGGIIFKGKPRIMDGYYIIFTDPYTWVILDFAKTFKKNGSTKAGETLK